MKRFSEQFHKKATSVTMQSAEARDLRARVVSYMEYHPLPESLKSTTKSVRSPLFEADAFQAIRIPTSMLFRASAVFTALVLIVVPMLAERSVPGDNLYAVKVRFNEEVRGTLAFTPYQKIEWETERLNRRVAEARLLASEGRLTDTVEAEIAAAVKEHTDSVRAEIDELRTEDADQATLASIELATTLAVQSASLQEEGNTTLALAIDDVNSPNSATLVVNAINQSLTEQLNQVEAAELPAYDKVMARLEQNTTRAYELLQSLGLKPEEALYNDLNRRLDDVGRSVVSAQEKRGQDEGTAREMLLGALERTQKLIVYMSDVSATNGASVEAVVPIILTAEEELAQSTILSSEIERKSEILALVVPRLSPGTAEKVDRALAAAATEQASEGLAILPLSQAKEIIALLDDALALVAAEGIDITSVLPTVTESVATTTATTTEEVVSESEGQ